MHVKGVNAHRRDKRHRESILLRAVQIRELKAAGELTIQFTSPNTTQSETAPYQVGDRIYVRETYGAYFLDNPESNSTYYLYRADYPDDAKGYWYEPEAKIHFCDFPKWRPATSMPKDAARLFIRVVEVREEHTSVGHMWTTKFTLEEK